MRSKSATVRYLPPFRTAKLSLVGIPVCERLVVSYFRMRYGPEILRRVDHSKATLMIVIHKARVFVL
jgi:hypothetical protein